MRNKLILCSILYFLGIIILVMTGLQAMNWMAYIAIFLGIVLTSYAFTVENKI